MTVIDEIYSASSVIPTVALNDEAKMPVLGLGVAKLSDEETESSVLAALEAGCRLIDTAASYGNEEAVGRAIAASGIPREELFVATKLGTSRQGFQSAQESCKESLDRLGLDYLDLYLIHWPAPKLGKYVESFEGMKVARDEGHVRSIGVCNFTEELLANVIEETDEVPAVNQVELHPRLNQAELRQAHAQHDVTTQSYSPLGVGKMLEDPTVTAIAAEYGRTPAQVLVRWNLQLDNVVVSRSSKPERVAQNLDVFDFTLEPEHMEAIDGLHDGTRVLHDPMTFMGT
ncbi:aldo/keto reductase [Mycobacterium intracellulare]|uniref:2,5-diketo-D-gluconic acid reductase B n=1 Tax=Mycobacterium intracellulare subsp. chimaera TaxID=222805 RepID=A0A7U5MPF7_MYCIT|nr:aldo/keto reductase [Mycobacterium intracellulare]AGP65932.1 2,5-diketo-D-gluconic acid reductase B [Mycobacterium intracellulare subsp. yongonense 05-1390]ARR79991.1 oxidoreductase of aldo/keto reductase family, subgroup 1 [Mycobacterium intracellulare subsp. yongonense]ASL17311.1 2,5-diketo-D-gluconic acid reductase B [Mycobacterium intracellulare subsp. chimaera]MCF1814712.1 aldo/keto reductase [Mycobacterium intracellulare subsp. intracellulare]MDM3928191.1 aldo/keto reductase [Mycobact